VAQHGLAIDTSVPAKADLAAWIRTWSTTRHGITLAVATAERLLERLGGNLGQIDQALARLAAAARQHCRSLNNEDFEKIDLTATHYPYLAAGGGA
jgi:DNA polymerase III delta subunit